MINVGVIGIGTMGNTHLDVYAKRDDVNVLALSDIDPDRVCGKGKAEGNIRGQAQGGFQAFDKARQYDEGMKLIADDQVELVDICLPTPLHRQYAEAALAAGKHVLVEKPLARTAEDARALAKAAESAKGLAMPAMCMRFWPGWDWLKETVEKQTYGKVYAAHFTRLASHPGGPFYSDGDAAGGALLDLHIHDTDFIQWCFGMPKEVYSCGYKKLTSATDHVLTHYRYDGGPMITAEGGWVMAKGFGFNMQFTVNFEHATARFDVGKDPSVTLAKDGKCEPVDVGTGIGYQHEIAYFLDCIANNRAPQRVTLADGARTVAIAEAEERSIASGKPEPVTTG